MVPVFSDLFESFGAELPAFTQMVVGMSEWMQAWWFILIVVIGGAIIGFSEAKKQSKKFRDFLDRAVLKAPIFGNIAYQAVIARFARTLSTTFAAGSRLLTPWTLPLEQQITWCFIMPFSK